MCCNWGRIFPLPENRAHSHAIQAPAHSCRFQACDATRFEFNRRVPGSPPPVAHHLSSPPSTLLLGPLHIHLFIFQLSTSALAMSGLAMELDQPLDAVRSVCRSPHAQPRSFHPSSSSRRNAQIRGPTAPKGALRVPVRRLAVPETATLPVPRSGGMGRRCWSRPQPLPPKRRKLSLAICLLT